MLFEETLNKYNLIVEEAVDELFDAAYKNQEQKTDLLLVLENALKNNYPIETLKRHKLTPYQIGLDEIGFRYNSFYKFINQYRDKIFSKDELATELLKDHFDKDYAFHYFIEQELLIYLKFWETDLILRKLYNISRLIQGLDYVWDYDQNFFNNRRKVIRDEIQTNIEEHAPKFCQLLDDIYNRQLRNAIGHSQYYLIYDTISLTNKDQDKYYQLNSISYDDWEIIFHKTILFYNHLIRCTNEYSKRYIDLADGKHYGLMIYFPERNYLGTEKTGWLKYDNKRMRWSWFK
jgi:hypothetical protein